MQSTLRSYFGVSSFLLRYNRLNERRKRESHKNRKMHLKIITDIKKAFVKICLYFVYLEQKMRFNR